MRKEDFFSDHYENLEEAAREAARFLWLCRKTEDLIKEMAIHEAPLGWTDKDVAYCIEKTGAFEFSLDDVRYINEIMKDEYLIDAEKTIDYLLGVMADMKSEERYDFYMRNVKTWIDSRDSYKRGYKYNFPGIIYYKDEA